jgi:hypothetical protein
VVVDIATSSGVEVTGNHTIVGVGERMGVGENIAAMESCPVASHPENSTPTIPKRRMAFKVFRIGAVDILFMLVWSIITLDNLRMRKTGVKRLAEKRCYNPENYEKI